jgi:hypothetical protein
MPKRSSQPRLRALHDKEKFFEGDNLNNNLDMVNHVNEKNQDDEDGMSIISQPLRNYKILNLAKR